MRHVAKTHSVFMFAFLVTSHLYGCANGGSSPQARMRAQLAVPESNQTFPFVDQDRSIETAVGAYLVYRMEVPDAEGTPRVSVSETRLVGQEEDTLWLETDIYGEAIDVQGKARIRVSPGDSSDVELLEVYIKEGDAPLYDYTDSPILDLAAGAVFSAATAYRSDIRGDERRSKTVHAGEFLDCVVQQARSPFLSGEDTFYLHPAIPGAGLAYFEGADGSTQELIDFGYDGAVSTIDERKAKPFGSDFDALFEEMEL